MVWTVELLLRVVLARFAVVFSLFWGGVFATTDLIWITTTRRRVAKRSVPEIPSEAPRASPPAAQCSRPRPKKPKHFFT